MILTPFCTVVQFAFDRGVVLPIYASEVERFGVEAESLRPIVYHRPLQPYAPEDSPWVSNNLDRMG